MKDAKSMYRGGDIVEAKHCDFDSSRLLGLVCPFCNEAVFLRAGTSRVGKNKTVLVNPSFCHYPGSAEDFDCERRSISADGRKEIERIKAEKRGQRLELYNKHLWDMIATKIDPVRFKQQAFLGIDKMPRFAQKKLQALVKAEFIRLFANASDEGIALLWEKNNTVNYEENENLARAALAMCEGPSGLRFQRVLVREISAFLSTKTSGFCFRNLFYAGLSNALCCEMRKMAADPDFAVFIVTFMMSSELIRTPWEAQIERFSNPDRKAADEKYYALLEEARRRHHGT